ncbi:MAG: hypothetical protein WBA73_11925 [Devosia sp.]
MSNDNPAIPANFSDPMSSGALSHRSNGLAFAEGLALLGVGALLDYTGLLPFALLPVHPYLFVVILLSAQYGIQGGILSALGAVALSHINGLPARPIDMTYAEYFRMAWADSLSWVLAALTVGIVTSQRGRVLQEQTAKLRKATLAESLIAAQYQVLAQRTHKLERSLAGRADAPSAESRTQSPTHPETWIEPASRPRRSGTKAAG